MITRLSTKDLFDTADTNFREKILQYFKFVCAVSVACDNGCWIEGPNEWGVVTIDETTKIMCAEFDTRFRIAMRYFLRNVLSGKYLDYMYVDTNPRGMETIGFSRHGLYTVISKDELCKILSYENIDISQIQEAVNSITTTGEYIRQDSISGFDSLASGCVNLLHILNDVYPNITYPEELVEYVTSMKERFHDSVDMDILMNNLK